MTFGDLLRSHRIARGLSQNELGRRAGVTPGHVNRIEHGAHASRDVVLNMAAALELSAEDTDRLLYAAGHSPQRDYQTILDIVLKRLVALRPTYLQEVSA